MQCRQSNSENKRANIVTYDADMPVANFWNFDFVVKDFMLDFGRNFGRGFPTKIAIY